MTIQPWETDPAAVAYEFMTAGGLNTPDQIADMIGDRDVADAAASFADEAAENWTLHVDHAELQAAIAEFITDRPDVEPSETDQGLIPIPDGYNEQ